MNITVHTPKRVTVLANVQDRACFVDGFHQGRLDRLVGLTIGVAWYAHMTAYAHGYHVGWFSLDAKERGRGANH